MPDVSSIKKEVKNGGVSKLSDGELEQYVERIHDYVDTSAENGMFRGKDVEFSNIQTNILSARSLISSDRSKSRNHLSAAIKDYSAVLNSKSITWRFSNLYGGDMWIYLTGFLAVIFFMYYFQIDSMVAKELHVSELAVDATVFGVIGGILRGLWKLWNRVNVMQFRRIWRIYFLSCPFLGGIFGAVLYILIIAGLLVLSQSTTVSQTNQQLVVMGFAAIAGYNWEWAIKRIEKVGEML